MLREAKHPATSTLARFHFIARYLALSMSIKTPVIFEVAGFFAPLRMTVGFGLCFKLGLRNVWACKNSAGWQ